MFKHAAICWAIKSNAGLSFDKAAAMHIDKSLAVDMGRPARSSQQHVPRLLSSALHHNYHPPSPVPHGPQIIRGVHTPTQSSRSSHPAAHSPPLNIFLALALILDKLHNNMLKNCCAILGL